MDLRRDAELEIVRTTGHETPSLAQLSCQYLRSDEGSHYMNNQDVRNYMHLNISSQYSKVDDLIY